MPARYGLRYLRSITRWRKWGHTKISFLLACMFYATLFSPASPADQMVRMAELLLVILVYGSFGYMANSYSDRTVDYICGKKNAMAAFSPRKGSALLILMAAVGMLLSVLLVDRASTTILLAVSYTIAAFYSLSPVRLKERGYFGLLSSTVAQRTLPAAIVFEAMDAWSYAAISMCTLSTLIGTRYIIVHQVADRDNDLLAGVRTVASSQGSEHLIFILRRFLFPLELAALATTVVLLSQEVYSVAVGAAAYSAWTAARTGYLETKKPLFDAASARVLSDFYDIVVPASLAIALVLQDVRFWPVVVFTALWLLAPLRREVSEARRLLIAPGRA